MIRWLILTIALAVSTETYSSTLADLIPTHRLPQENPVYVPTEASVNCLALNIFFESRNQGTQGWLAVAFVTINRVIDPRFPDTICEVVWEPKQFSWTHDGLSDKPDLSKYPDRKAWRYILEFSRGFLENHQHIHDPTHGSLYYHKNTIEPFWRDNFEVAVEIGEHIFYINQGRYR